MLFSHLLCCSLLSNVYLISARASASFFDDEPYTGSQEQLDRARSVASQRIATRTSVSAPAPTYSNFTGTVNKHANISQSDIDNARAVVAAALADSYAANRARTGLPLRNNYFLRRSSSTKPRRDAVSLPIINSSIAAAAALVAELDAAALAKNGTLHGNYSEIEALHRRRNGEPEKRQSATFWMEGIEHLGTQLGNSSYKVRINLNNLKSHEN